MEMLLVAQGAGAVMETVGGVMNADAKGKVAGNNARLVSQEASEEARLASAEGRRLVSKARVRAGASGLSVDGSALDVIGELEAEGEFRSRTAIHEGRIQYDNFKAEERAAKREKVAIIGKGVADIGSTLLTSGFGGGATDKAAMKNAQAKAGL